MARVAITAGLAVAGSTTAQAAAWNIQSQGSIQSGHDDNVRLSAIDPVEANYSAADLSAHLGLHNEAWSLSIAPRAIATRYWDYDILNRTETYLTSAFERQTETASSSLSFNVTRDTTLTSELGLTGFAETNKPHQSMSLSTTQTNQWTERLSTQAMLHAVSHRYSNADNTGLLDYNYGNAQFGVQYALSQRSRVSIDASFGKLQVPNFAHYGKTNESVTASYITSLAERWQFKLSAGPSKVRSDLSSESGTVYEAALTRKSEIANLQLKASRDITPTGQGILARRQQWSLVQSANLTERLSVGVRASLAKNDNLYLLSQSISSGVRYRDVNASINWHWTPQTTLSMAAGYTDQRAQESDYAAKRKYIVLSITWASLSHSLN